MTNEVTTSTTFRVDDYATLELTLLAAKEWLEVTRAQLHGSFAKHD